MIKDVPLTGNFVNDQEAALDFYTEKLGLEKGQDESLGEGAPWITVSPVGSGTRIALKKAERAMVGRSDGAPVLTLGTGDVQAAYGRRRERGVRFLGAPYRHPSGLAAPVERPRRRDARFSEPEYQRPYGLILPRCAVDVL